MLSYSRAASRSSKMFCARTSGSGKLVERKFFTIDRQCQPRHRLARRRKPPVVQNLFFFSLSSSDIAGNHITLRSYDVNQTTTADFIGHQERETRPDPSAAHSKPRLFCNLVSLNQYLAQVRPGDPNVLRQTAFLQASWRFTLTTGA